MGLGTLFASRGQHGLADTSDFKQVNRHGSRFAVALATIAAAGLVLSSAAFGAFYAWSVGEAKGIAFAAVMVAMAVSLEIAKPMAIAAALQAFRRWALVHGALLLILAGVAIAYSL